MHDANDQDKWGKWQRAQGKQRPHWTVRTLNNLPKSNGKYQQLVAQLQARQQAAKELGQDQPPQKPDDFSI